MRVGRGVALSPLTQAPPRPRPETIFCRFSSLQASETVPGLTPSRKARSRTVGSRVPTGRRPERIIWLRSSAMPRAVRCVRRLASQEASGSLLIDSKMNVQERNSD